MLSKQHIDTVLQTFCEGLGLAGHGLDDDLSCPLLFDDELTVLVVFDPAGNRLVLATEVAELPPGDETELPRRLLTANLLGQESRGATFAVDAETRTVMLHSKIEGGDLDIDRFSACLERHLDVATAWSNALAGGPPSDESDHRNDNTEADPAQAVQQPPVDDTKARWQQALGWLTEQLDLGNAEVDDEAGYCALTIDDDTVVELFLEPTRGALIMASVVGRMPPQRQYTLLLQLLASNLFWYATGGGTLGLDDDDSIVLHRELELGPALDPTRLLSELSDFVALVEDWQAALEHAAQTAPAEPQGLRV